MPSELFQAPVTPDPPCSSCHGCCCRTRPGATSLAVLLDGEREQFPEAVRRKDGEWALPVTAAGQCIHLGSDNLCQIYETRPHVCRSFNCANGYWLWCNQHGFFLQNNPEVVTLLENSSPEFVQFRQQERTRRPEF